MSHIYLLCWFWVDYWIVMLGFHRQITAPSLSVCCCSCFQKSLATWRWHSESLLSWRWNLPARLPGRSFGPACLDVSTKTPTEKPMRLLFGRQRRWLMSTQRTLSRFASPRSSKGQTACWSRTKVTKHLWLRYLADLIWIAFPPLIPVFFSLCLSSISRLLIHNMLILDDETSLTPFKPEDQHFPDYDTQKGISSNLSAKFFTFEAELSLPRNIYRAILIYYYYSSVNLMLFQPRINKPCFYALNNGCLIAPEVQLQVKGIAVEVEFLRFSAADFWLWTTRRSCRRKAFSFQRRSTCAWSAKPPMSDDDFWVFKVLSFGSLLQWLGSLLQWLGIAGRLGLLVGRLYQTVWPDSFSRMPPRRKASENAITDLNAVKVSLLALKVSLLAVKVSLLAKSNSSSLKQSIQWWWACSPRSLKSIGFKPPYVSHFSHP